MSANSPTSDDEINKSTDTDDTTASIEERLFPSVPATPVHIVYTLSSSEGKQTPEIAGMDKTTRQPVPRSSSKLAGKASPPVVGSMAAVPSPYISPTHPARRGQVRRVRVHKRMLRYISRKHLRRGRALERRARRRFWTFIWSLVISFLVAFLSVGAVAGFTAYHFFTQTQLKYERQVLTLRDLLPRDNLKMFDSKGVLIGQLTDEGIHTTVKLGQVAKTLQSATVAVEDKDFWKNQGVDVLRIIRAALDNLEKGQVVEGGSTITQQLIKNLIVGREATIVRKLEEIVLTPQLNTHYSKRDILEMYVNSIYYGEQAYGIDAAATIYFGLEDRPGRPASMQLDLAQSAMLAGIPSSPAAFDPLLHPQTAFIRFETVLDLMVSQKYITKIDQQDAVREAQRPDFFKTPTSLQNRAPHFFNFALSELLRQPEVRRMLDPTGRQVLTTKDLSRSGLIVYTTLDIDLQDKIQQIAQEHIAELHYNNVTNAAEVLMDFHTGAIISLLGSLDYNNKSIDGQFDVATQGYRQPGSSFKPYVYVTAFEQGASPAQAIDDKAVTLYLPGSTPPVWSPGNYDRRFHGHMTLRCALQNSLNVPAVKVLQHVGIDAAMKTAYDMGVTSYRGTPGYSLVLGGLGIRLLDHTIGYGTFANGGVYIGYYAVNKVVFANSGETIYQHQHNPGKRVISPQLSYMMTNVLSDNGSRTPEFYDCNLLQLYANSQQDCWYGNRGAVRPAAVKTGTTEDFRDNWTIGYTTDFVMGVWAGNDDNSPMIGVTGVQGAAPIWHDSMLLAEEGHPIRDFVNPGGLDLEKVTYPDGVQTTDWFLPGTVPTFQPTSTPTPGPTGSPTATASPTPVPGNGSPSSNQPPATPYCPSSYTFAFSPPADDVQSPDPGWW